MKKSFLIVIVTMLCTLCFTFPSTAHSQDLGVCLVDSLDGKERKQLAKWIYYALAAHPEMKSYSTVSSEDLDEMHKYVGDLVTRLLTEDCAMELKKSFKGDPTVVEKAFEVVGQVAMQEILLNSDVNDALIGYIKYTDMDKLETLLANE